MLRNWRRALFATCASIEAASGAPVPSRAEPADGAFPFPIRPCYGRPALGEGARAIPAAFVSSK